MLACFQKDTDRFCLLQKLEKMELAGEMITNSYDCPLPCTMIASVPGSALYTIQKFVYFIMCITRGGSILCVYMEVIIIK